MLRVLTVGALRGELGRAAYTLAVQGARWRVQSRGGAGAINEGFMTQNTTSEISPNKMGPIKIGTGKIGATKIGVGKIGTKEIATDCDKIGCVDA